MYFEDYTDYELHALDSVTEPRMEHPQSACLGRFCVIHNPSGHHMVDWRLNWCGEDAPVERICPHGVGHPDPDDLVYQQTQGRGYQAEHECDGCCVT